MSVRGVWLGCILVFAGCTTVSFTPFERELPAKPAGPCSAMVLNRAPADGRYVEPGFCTVDVFPRVTFFGGVASLPSVRGTTEYTPQAVEKLRRCACAHGGNAVVVRGDGGDFSPASETSATRVKPHGTVLYIPPERE